jgi:hypothetical protein
MLPAGLPRGQPAAFLAARDVEPLRTIEPTAGYYPYVTKLPGGWVQVVPTPPQTGKEGAPQ